MAAMTKYGEELQRGVMATSQRSGIELSWNGDVDYRAKETFLVLQLIPLLPQDFFTPGIAFFYSEPDLTVRAIKTLH